MFMEENMILQVENICKHYQQFALNNVSFALPKGAIMGLIGENGAGKSTTMKALLGMISLDSGKISIFGHEGITAQDREAIGVVFDELAFNQTMNVSDIGKVMKNVYRNWEPEQYQQYLEKFKLPQKKQIKDFSLGMKMKLSLAVAMSHHAKLLILDEPTSGLDPVVRAEILDLFLEFIADGESSILVSSHITSDLERVADYITFVHQGKVLMSKNKDDILYSYGIAKADRETIHSLNSSLVMKIKDGKYDSEALIRDKESFSKQYPNVLVDAISLDDLMVMLCTD